MTKPSQKTFRSYVAYRSAYYPRSQGDVPMAGGKMGLDHALARAWLGEIGAAAHGRDERSAASATDHVTRRDQAVHNNLDSTTLAKHQVE